MAITVAASWYVASKDKRRRSIGFCLFMLSNVAWTVWGLHTHAYALVVLQVCLAVLNIRGVLKTEPATLDTAA
jgi:hypothetical protein